MHDCVVLYTHTTHRATLPATQTGVAPPLTMGHRCTGPTQETAPLHTPDGWSALAATSPGVACTAGSRARGDADTEP